MKEISASIIIDEAVNKLEGLKHEIPNQLAVKELYTVRAYCDLLLKALGEHSEEGHSLKKKQSSPLPATQRVVSDDASSGSIFDF
ncbi:hypothetical protein DCC39_15710 [Pueribacillus theae]|uniref:Uncharacterized protein n=1 Tax=Pueribacillus theae TaxID=2171751 RepID=A0A2U1JS25_9BACI|nr:hypothetical protein [Pueribacillus theae]PWA08010.1 hypothetical protein DCC39_15710 [Pueribacillus theae]